MQKSLAQIFNEMAAAAHEAFPEELKNLVVLIIPSGTPIYVSPEIADHLSNNVAAVKRAVEERTNYMRANDFGGVASDDYPLAEATVKMLAMLALDEKSGGIHSPRYTKEMRAIADLDHEIGHLIVENGFSSSVACEHLAECAADAYAALRHIQHFGRKTDYFEYCTYVDQVVLGLSPKHYTDAVTQRVKQLAGETDISGLSLRETAALAGKIALECSLDDKTLEKISVAFSPAANAFKEAGELDDAVFLNCIEVMLEHKDDPDVYRAGERFLNRPDIKEYLENKAKTDPYWRNALDFIENHKIKPVKKQTATQSLAKK
ncbi:MAG: hypothetical protein V1721_09015 [Pseudomonadota bacterium]